MSGNKNFQRKYSGKVRNDKSKKNMDKQELIDEDNPIIKMFRQYALQLDAKHDRHERIFKLSRDITIESKRIIFLLHNNAADFEELREKIFDEAEDRLNQLMEKNFRNVATELEGQDHYLFLRAYTGGLQEFIEALLFYQFSRYSSIEPFQNIQKKLQYKCPSDEEENKAFKAQVDTKELPLVVPMNDFILGLGDFTGELMRRCINSLSSGNFEDCFSICNYVKDIYTGFLSVNTTGYKDIGRKLYVLKQSLLKMEYVCYTLQVRGSEIPKHMLAAVITNAEENNDVDEGFY